MLTASIRASISADIAVQPRNLQLWSSSCPHRRASSKFSLQLRVWQASPRRGVPAQASSSDNFRDARLSQAANRFAEGQSVPQMMQCRNLAPADFEALEILKHHYELLIILNGQTI